MNFLVQITLTDKQARLLSEDSQQSTSLVASHGDFKERENIQMDGHIEYINGFPIWVDEDTNLKTSFTSVSLGIAEDLPYYSSTTTTPVEDFNMKDNNGHICKKG